MIKAAIDIGTNSTRLLVAEIKDSKATNLHREARITRLGQGVDKTRFLAPVAIKRTIDVLAEYKKIAQELGAQDLVVTATSAARDAQNATIFIEKVKNSTGLQLKILDPQQEARLSFLGALNCLDNINIANDKVLVLDIGGGSTEMTLGNTADKKPQLSFSKDIGSVRLTELYIKHDPPLETELEQAQVQIKDSYKPVIEQLQEHEYMLIGTAGTITTVAALALGLEEYSSEKVHCSSLSINSVEEIYNRLKNLSINERKQIKVIQPGREDVIVTGALILLIIMQMLTVDEMIVSETDILDGLLQVPGEGLEPSHHKGNGF